VIGSRKAQAAIPGIFPSAFPDIGESASLHEPPTGEINMRKRLIQSEPSNVGSSDPAWLPLEEMTSVEITSEAAAYPIECALLPSHGSEWRAEAPGRQVIRLSFDQPQSLSRIHLEFNEHHRERTQEYVLRWSSDDAKTFREIARQQFNFSSPDATREIEDHVVELQDVTLLELIVTPDISGGDVRASLTRLQLA
jgi:hypothetical protein